MSALIVNLFSGPGAGKSTTASGVFFNLKKLQVNCELVPEFAKELTWENRVSALDNQPYVLGKQLHRLQRVMDQVDVIITDTSIFYGIIYAPPDYYPSFKQFVSDVFHGMNNMNFFIERVKPYLAVGRRQTEEGAKRIDGEVRKALEEYNVPYECVPGSEDGVLKITRLVYDSIK